MTHEICKTSSAAAVLSQSDILVNFSSQAGREVEMTRDARLLLEREMAGTLGNPLTALMAQVAIEYRDMATSPVGA